MFRAVSILALLAIAASSAPAVADHYEYSLIYQPNLAQIGVTRQLHDDLKAYIADSTAAKNVAIAILDGRADPNHIDLNGRLTVHIVYSGRYRRYDNHGTHVAGIAGASQNVSGIVGVAPTAKLLSIPVFDDRRWVASDLGKAALDKAVSLNAKVANMSYGPVTDGDVFLNGELNLFDDYRNSLVLVRAAGNDGINASHEYYAYDASTLLSHLLIVGSVGPNSQISDFSTRPGTACIAASSVCSPDDLMMNFFIVAPGESILSDLPGNKLGYMSGTSMAAPHVAGAAALVFQEAIAGNTYLTPGEVASILKLSATDLGTQGVDAVYGHGLLNVAAALGPIGGTYVATGSTVEDGLVATSSSTVTTSSVLGRSGALEAALSGMVIFDGFKRGYVLQNVELSGSQSTLAADAMATLSSALAQQSTTQEEGPISVTFTSLGAVEAGGFNALSLSSELYAIEAGLGGVRAYFTDSSPGSSDTFARQLGTEFFTGAGDVGEDFEQAFFVGGDFAFNSRVTLSALHLGGFEESLASHHSSFYDPASSDETLSGLMKLGIRYELNDAAALGFSYGMLKEQGQILGIESSGALSLGDSGLTQLLGVSLKTQLGEKAELTAFGELSSTSAEMSDSSRVFSVTDEWWGSRFGVALGWSDFFKANDHFQLSLVRPWVIHDGDLTAQVAIGRELDGTVNYETREVSLAVDDLPADLGLTYTAGDDTLSYGATLSLGDADVRQISVDDFTFALAAKLAF